MFLKIHIDMIIFALIHGNQAKAVESYVMTSINKLHQL